MRTLIIGAGAVGSVIGAYMARNGGQVTIADGWFHHVEAIRRHGLRVEAVEQDFAIDVEALHLDELPKFGGADLVVLAGKSYDTRMLALLGRENMHDTTVVMSAQNGMNDCVVSEIVGAERTVGCVVAMAVDLLEAGLVRRTSQADVAALTIGHLRPEHMRDLTPFAEALGALGRVDVAPDIWPERWGKLTLNSMSNGLAGLTGLRSELLWSSENVLDVAIALAHETAMVAAASGVYAAPVLGRITHDTLLDADRRGNPAWCEALNIMREIASVRVGRRGNRASLLQDIEKGRRTEIRHLNGWVAARGAALGVAAPTHAKIVSEIETVERRERPAAGRNADVLVASVRDLYG